jgi:hypothetical protein
VLRKKLFIGVRGVGGTDALPLPILRELLDARTGLRRKLAVRVPMEKFAVALDRVRRLGRSPVLLFAAASAQQGHQDY